MKNLSSHISPNQIKTDKILDSTLRPESWDEYIGQTKIKKNLQIIIEAANKRNETPDHILFYGNAGLGKTTLAQLIAKEMNANIRVIAGPVIEKAGDLASILTNLTDGDILFIDEIHRLHRVVEEYLYPVMEDFKLNIILGKGPMAQTMELDIPKFTLIGATTKVALLSSPLRSRFGATFQLDFYTQEDIEKIIQRSAYVLNIEIKPEAIKFIAQHSRYTPRVANRLLKRIRDFAQVEENGIITKNISEKTLNFLEISEKGLEYGDRKILETLIKKFNGGPAGLQALAAATSEEEDAILDVYEPYLMQMGFIERTSRGRTATKLAYEYIGIKYDEKQQNLL